MEAGYVLHFLTQRSVMGEGLSGENKPISDNQSNINISQLSLQSNLFGTKCCL
jgi:hypothetical protein